MEAQDSRKPFSDKDVLRVSMGNLQLRRLLPLLRLLVKYKSPFTLENPGSSNIWWIPQLRALLRFRGVQLIEIDQCFFGRRWRKRTKLLCVFLDDQDLESLSQCRCHGRRICQHTGRRHIQLTGHSKSGVPMTFLAQEFPARLSNKLAHCLVHKVITRRTTS